MKETITRESDRERETLGLYAKESFRILSWLWLRVGWQQKYSYSFTWMGRPIIQLPEDMIRVQEVICQVQPDVIVETGVAHGGSIAYYASICKILGRGRVIGIDVKIRPQNRRAIEEHPLAPLITLVEGDSVSRDTVEKVKSLIVPGETVMVFLDSCHRKQHVLAELEAYHSVVTPGSYIVAADGVMRELYDVPGGEADWIWDNPATASTEFVQQHAEFEIAQPRRLFDEGGVAENITYWPEAWIRRK